MSDIKEAGSLGFLHAKRTVVSAIDHRLEILTNSLEILRKAKEVTPDNDIYGYEARIDELESLRDYIRNGMLWKVE
jgi:hypothetical protein